MKERAERGRCEHCEAPLPVRNRGRGRPTQYCSEACMKAAYRQRLAQAKPQEDPPGARCLGCGQRLSGEGLYCSDRCYYLANQDRLPADKRHLAAWDEELIPSFPEGRQPSRPAWYGWVGWVYGGEERPRPVGPGPEERRLQQFEAWRALGSYEKLEGPLDAWEEELCRRDPWRRRYFREELDERLRECKVILSTVGGDEP